MVSTGTMATILNRGDTVSAESAKELDDLCQLTLRLNLYTIQWLGKAMDDLVRQERRRWLDPIKTTFHPGTGKDMFNTLYALPVEPGNLFPGGVPLMEQANAEQETQRKLAAGVMAPPPTTPSPATAKKKQPAKKKPATSSDRSRSSSASSSYSRKPHYGETNQGNTRPPPPTSTKNPRNDAKGRRGGMKGK